MNRTIRSGLTVALLLFWHFIALQPAAASVIVGGWDFAHRGGRRLKDGPVRRGSCRHPVKFAWRHLYGHK